MTIHKTWAEALKISPESLSEWSALAPAGEPLLVWCLTAGHVSTEDYLEWACETYGLPILNSAFFHQSFDRTTLTPEVKEGPWTAWCFPVSQWEDVAIIACVEPPADKPEGKYCFVLSDPAVMNEVWCAPGAELAADATKPEAPDGINPNVTRTFVLNLDDLTTGFAGEKTGTTLTIVKDPNSATAPPLPTPAAAKAQPKASAPPPMPIPVAKAPAKVAQAKSVNEDTEIQAGFERLKADYQASLIMRCSETLAKPYKWDGNLKIDPATDASTVTLSYPSFFRIVVKTMQPYHGYVVDSPVHSEFFDSLNFKTPPACVTAIPLKANGKLWGILVAFGGESAQTAEALDSALQVADKLTKTFEGTWAKAA